MVDKFVKPIREKGIVISKVVNKAREAGQNFDGSIKWDARPEEYVVTVLSCDEDDFNKETGFLNRTIENYKVDKAVFDAVKFGSWGNVKFIATEVNGKIVIKTESFTPLSNN